MACKTSSSSSTVDSFFTALKSVDFKYQTLFTPEVGYLSFKGKEWQLSKEAIPSGEKGIDRYKSMMEEIVRRGLEDILNPKDFIIAVNTKWMELNKEFSVKPSSGSEIVFGSKNVQFQWLSNYFPTLFYIQEESKKEGKVYLSVDQAYTAKKFTTYASFSMNEKMLLSPKSPIHQLSTLHPNKSKRATRKTIVSSEIGIERIDTMTKIAKEKFSQNPPLAELLKQTDPYILRADTHHEYWGGQVNNMGQILMEIRKSLLYPDQSSNFTLDDDSYYD